MNNSVDTSKCPYHQGNTTQATTNNVGGEVLDVLSKNFTEEELQREYARVIGIVWNEQGKAFRGYISDIMSEIYEEGEVTSYDALTNELFGAAGRKFYQIALGICKDQKIAKRIEAGFNTFHSFIKKGIPYKKNYSDHPNYLVKQAVQMASTHIERAQIAVRYYDGWDVFYDPNIDVSKLFLGIGTESPTYKCPVLHSGVFREVFDWYVTVMEGIWEHSLDKPIARV